MIKHNGYYRYIISNHTVNYGILRQLKYLYLSNFHHQPDENLTNMNILIV